MTACDRKQTLESEISDWSERPLLMKANIRVSAETSSRIHFNYAVQMTWISSNDVCFTFESGPGGNIRKKVC
jgi:hypothetical protein